MKCAASLRQPGDPYLLNRDPWLCAARLLWLCYYRRKLLLINDLCISIAFRVPAFFGLRDGGGDLERIEPWLADQAGNPHSGSNAFRGWTLCLPPVVGEIAMQRAIIVIRVQAKIEIRFQPEAESI